jgi:hypothetical protein
MCCPTSRQVKAQQPGCRRASGAGVSTPSCTGYTSRTVSSAEFFGDAKVRCPAENHRVLGKKRYQRLCRMQLTQSTAVQTAVLKSPSCAQAASSWKQETTGRHGPTRRRIFILCRTAGQSLPPDRRRWGGRFVTGPPSVIPYRLRQEPDPSHRAPNAGAGLLPW